MKERRTLHYGSEDDDDVESGVDGATASGANDNVGGDADGSDAEIGVVGQVGNGASPSIESIS